MSNLTLSITTIGDLLLRQKITNGDKPIEDVSLNIPIYQRPYKWTARNAIQLLDDIIEAMNSNKEKYRVGTLILHQHKGDRYDIVVCPFSIVKGVRKSCEKAAFNLLCSVNCRIIFWLF